MVLPFNINNSHIYKYNPDLFLQSNIYIYFIYIINDLCVTDKRIADGVYAEISTDMIKTSGPMYMNTNQGNLLKRVRYKLFTLHMVIFLN